MREIVIDTETTGLDHKKGDRVIEVGCVELINHVSTNKHLQFYCSVEKQITESAQKVHGLTNSFLSSYPSFQEQVDSFLEFIKDDVLIIHNADFDTGFLNNELKIAGRKPLKNKIVDTVRLARKILNSRIANLDYLCKRFSIDLSNRSYHGALLDSQLLAEVYLELKGGKQISMDLNAEKKSTQNLATNNHNKSLNFFEVRVSSDEIKKHKLMTKQLKNSLWEKIDY
tara:strand:- start:690 stop:1370 length:681 start_codon:yes stop_codon:yes gene_type:complete